MGTDVSAARGSTSSSKLSLDGSIPSRGSHTGAPPSPPSPPSPSSPAAFPLPNSAARRAAAAAAPPAAAAAAAAAAAGVMLSWAPERHSLGLSGRTLGSRPLQRSAPLSTRSRPSLCAASRAC